MLYHVLRHHCALIHHPPPFRNSMRCFPVTLSRYELPTLVLKIKHRLCWIGRRHGHLAPGAAGPVQGVCAGHRGRHEEATHAGGHGPGAQHLLQAAQVVIRKLVPSPSQFITVGVEEGNGQNSRLAVQSTKQVMEGQASYKGSRLSWRTQVQAHKPKNACLHTK
eukprot:1159191-Pelagomonas_calceolata.AAC.1